MIIEYDVIYSNLGLQRILFIFIICSAAFVDKIHVESLTDAASKMHYRDDGFDLSADVGEKDIFNFYKMTYNSSQEDWDRFPVSCHTMRHCKPFDMI